MKKLITISLILSVVSIVSAADVAGWESFVIRNSSSGNISPAITDDVGGGKLFEIELAGQKAAWGTNLVNGYTVGDLQSISIIRENTTSGWGPYMNIWVTDGVGGYACLSNEPSHPYEYTPETPYDTTWDIFQNATSWVYEVSGTAGFVLPDGTTTYSNLPAGTSDPFTFGDFADYIIVPPTTEWGGSGAPDDLNAMTYTAYGFNWVFGDTQDNYLGGYLVSAPTVIPEPATLALLGLGGLLLRKRK